MIKIVTDSASDITLSEAAILDINVVTLGVTFEGQAYEPAQDETFEEFYSLLASCKELPTTNQPSPAAYLPFFINAREQGDDVIVICLSSALSGTLQAATIAKDMSEYDRIWIIDSRNAILGQRLLVQYVLKLRDEGKPADEIAKLAIEATGRIRLFAALDTLKYLRKGGRIPKSAEMLGTVLGIKPLVSISTEGAVQMSGKARGHAGAVTGLIKLIDENNNFDSSMPVLFGYTQDAVHASNFRKLAASRYHLKNTALHAVGPVIGTHIGPGAMGICYFVK